MQDLIPERTTKRVAAKYKDSQLYNTYVTEYHDIGGYLNVEGQIPTATDCSIKSILKQVKHTSQE